jgi:putative transport-related protein
MLERVDLIKKIFGIQDKIVLNEYVLPEELEGITLINGYSGSGKSVFLRQYINTYHHYKTFDEPEDGTQPVINLIGNTIEEAFEYLGAVGLSEAFIYITSYNNLSEGQKMRFKIAKLLESGSRYIYFDEFLSNVDRKTARIIAYNIQKWLRKKKINAIFATCHSDLTDYLLPDNLVEIEKCGLYRKKTLICNTNLKDNILNKFEIRRGTFEDYNNLSKYHYLGEENIEETLRSTDAQIFIVTDNGNTIAVIVMATPYPLEWNCERFFEDINNRLRIVTRIIVHPQYRGIGVATLLLKYVSKIYPHIELRSAMCRFFPFPEKAGFQPVELPSNKREYRFELDQFLENKGFDSEDVKYNELINNLRDNEKKKLNNIIYNVYVRMLVDENKYFRELLGLNELSDAEKKTLCNLLKYIFSEIPVEHLFSEIEYFRMQSYIKHFTN